MHRPAKNKHPRKAPKRRHIGRTWQLQDAKAQLSQLVRDAQKLPQIITLHGREIAVVQSIHQYGENQKTGTRNLPSLFEALLKCPKGPEFKIPSSETHDSILDLPTIFD